MIGVIAYGGLGNRIAGLTGTYLLSLLSKRKYLIMGNQLNDYFNFSLVYPHPIKNIGRINISLSFTFYSYCLDPVDMINRIVKSKVYSIAISSIHDIIPVIIKSKKYYSSLRKLKFIKCSRRTDIISQIIEVNYVLYNKYFRFHERYYRIGKSVLKDYSNVKKIGIHVRLNDNCLKSCSVNIAQINKLNNTSNKYCNGSCVIMLSSFYKNFTNVFHNINKNVYSYNMDYDIKHTAFSANISQKDIEKIIMDIILTSNSDILTISGYSSYSLMILYMGYYQHYKTCKAKQYSFWTGGALFDHLNRFRKVNNCKNISSF